MNPQIVVEGAIERAAPSVMVKSKRVGGAVYQVPLEVRPNKKLFFSCKWMLEAARKKKGEMAINLAEEIMAAYAEQGAAVKKKEEAHRMAEANKAYAYMAKYVK